MTDSASAIPGEDGDAVSAANEVREVATSGWPLGYTYGATRYADVILQQSFPRRFADLVAALEGFQPTLDELRAGGGGRTVFVKRFDDSLAARLEGGSIVWGKQNITITKRLELDGTTVRDVRTRSHEIDMFGRGAIDPPLPGIAVEMEWNNKDPFFDRDLINFQALHHEGAIAVGVIVTRGPALQELVSRTIRSRDGGFKYGQSTTHWEKLLPRVDLGGGGECPLLLVGIETPRIVGFELAEDVAIRLDSAEHFKAHWRDEYARWSDAQPIYYRMRREALDLMPPVADERPSDA